MSTLSTECDADPPGSAALGMIVQEIPFGFIERLAASCLVGHILITYVGSLHTRLLKSIGYPNPSNVVRRSNIIN